MNIKETFPIENTSYLIWTCDWNWRVSRHETGDVSRGPVMKGQCFHVKEFASFTEVFLYPLSMDEDRHAFPFINCCIVKSPKTYWDKPITIL